MLIRTFRDLRAAVEDLYMDVDLDEPVMLHLADGRVISTEFQPWEASIGHYGQFTLRQP